MLTASAYTVALFGIPTLFGAVWGPAVDLYTQATATGETAVQTPPSDPGAHQVRLAGVRQVVPSAGLPSGVLEATLQSNNSLDAIRHGGRVFLAYRTASGPDASTSAVLVISSNDELTWRAETRVDLGTDLREPRFLSWDDRLLLYVNQIGTKPYSEESLEPLALELSEGTWSSPKRLGLAGHRIWRTKVISQGNNGARLPLMTSYVGGGSEARFAGEPSEVRLLTTQDGYEWHPLLAGQSSVYRGGGSEAAFTSDDDGNLYSVIRNEGGDSASWGSSVCFAPASNWSDWDCVNDPKRYDSPNLFSYGGEIYLLGRRNLSADGHYDQGFGPPLVRTLLNDLDYAATPKRCALWRYVKAEKRIAFVVDLPSRGDTCEPAVIAGNAPGEFVIYDYSSHLQGLDLGWFQSQAAPTFVYRHLLGFEKPARVATASSP